MSKKDLPDLADLVDEIHDARNDYEDEYFKNFLESKKNTLIQVLENEVGAFKEHSINEDDIQAYDIYFDDLTETIGDIDKEIVHTIMNTRDLLVDLTD